ncbi:hypothetical protein E2C01_022460 [Portunus trituberculatus]|uniref:Uncharacterized protein n=1 Tax=Portunus trituberculatus TaxID=210409 RepID=A0A5B7E619_PORTR|nr:hypothetical protein [Portunus trituberculatus]
MVLFVKFSVLPMVERLSSEKQYCTITLSSSTVGHLANQGCHTHLRRCCLLEWSLERERERERDLDNF